MVDALTAAGIAIVIITNGHHFVRPLRFPFQPRTLSLSPKRARGRRGVAQ